MASSFRRCGMPSAALLLAAVSVAPGAARGQGLALEAQLLVDGLTRPLGLADPGDGSGRLFVVEQTGTVRILRDGALAAQPFLDLGSEVSCCGERGLLGLALHPDYATNGQFYVAHTEPTANAAGAFDLLVARYTVSADPDSADPASRLELLRVEQPFGNHNGGHLAFGPDGYLYIGSGDGGSGGDPGNRGQDLDTLLGKLLRIDIDGTDPGRSYAVPPDNPFAADAPASCSDSCPAGPCGQTCDEIWALGLRNPWRFAFDPANGDLYVGDVGQNAWEEIDHQPASSPGGENYGWRRMEGNSCFEPPSDCNDGSLSLPILEYGHNVGCSVTGGAVYRGAAHPRLDGVYLYGDFCQGTVWGTVPRCDGAWQSQLLLDSPFRISSFGQNRAGEVYLFDYRESNAALYRLGPTAASGGAALRIDPQPIDFGSLVPGVEGSVELLLTNVNLGPEALWVSELSLGGDVGFILNPEGGADPCPSSTPCLPPGDSCTMELRFSGATANWFLAALEGTGNTEPAAAAIGACTATGALTLDHLMVVDDQLFDACDRIEVGPEFSVAAGASTRLRAGSLIVFGNGTTIAGDLEAQSGLP